MLVQCYAQTSFTLYMIVISKYLHDSKNNDLNKNNQGLMIASTYQKFISAQVTWPKIARVIVVSHSHMNAI